MGNNSNEVPRSLNDLENVGNNQIDALGNLIKKLNDWDSEERKSFLEDWFSKVPDSNKKPVSLKPKVSREKIELVKTLLAQGKINPAEVKLVGTGLSKKKKPKTPTVPTKWKPVLVEEVFGEGMVYLDDYRTLERQAQKTEELLIKREEALLFFAEISTLMLRSEYYIWHKKSKSGKLKVLCKPNDSLRALHAGLIKAINDSGFVAESDYAWQAGRTMYQHFANHVERRGKGGVFHRYWFIVDVKDAFESVDLKLLAVFLFELLYKWTPFKSDDLHIFLKKYFSHNETPGLARGLPASPILFNLFMERWIDSTLRAFAKRLGISYSRYGDDCVFSRNSRPITKAERELLAGCISPWVPLNKTKTRLYDVRVDKEFFLHSVGLRNGASGAELFYSQKTLMKIKGMLVRKLYGEYFEGENVLTGYLGFVQIKRWRSEKMSSLQKSIWELYKKAYPRKVKS